MTPPGIDNGFKLEPISKIGFWFKIAAGPSFPALLDSPSDLIRLVGRKPEAYWLYVEDLKRRTNKDIGPKDIFELGSKFRCTPKTSKSNQILAKVHLAKYR